MTPDEQQMLDHPAQGAYLVKIGTLFGLFEIRCAQHLGALSKVHWPMNTAIAKMQAHNERFHP